jgi:Ca-activated chloride channel family protein
MKSLTRGLLLLLLVVSCAAAVTVRFKTPETTVSADSHSKQNPGELLCFTDKGEAKGVCPLKHTDVKADITGFLSRVTVTQEFENPFKDTVEAVYTFPLPQDAAVDDMTMTIGDRTIRGLIKRREEAKEIYEAARQMGKTASLLDQERPNIFTQSVANLTPGAKVTIKISYVETLKYEEGTYQFVFPMVVGPRYIPGQPTGKQGGGTAPDTTQVPDASRVTPPLTPAGTRAGHDISLTVNLDAGVPITNFTSVNHKIESDRFSTNSARVTLQSANEIPNRDFVLKYDVAGKKIEDGMFIHRSDKGGYFTLMLQPPDRVMPADVTPKELVFVIDTSGSMMGFPLDKAKECMKLAMDNMYEYDTFNLITFSGDTHLLFPGPVPATRENLAKAQAFLDGQRGGGGTEMMTAIRAALEPSDKQDHIRIVCFMTDGYVGNDFEIIGEIQKHPNARVFSFGVGSSVNRFLLDGMAREGRGEVEYLSLNEDGSAAAKRLHERIRNPLLTDISLDFGNLPVTDVYPKRINDLFSAKPVFVTGRFTGPGKGTIKLRGKMMGKPYEREIPLNLPENEPNHDVLSGLWARNRIDDLMAQDLPGLQRGTMKPEIQEVITQIGLEYRLMTQFTSFVAVEETVVNEGGQQRRIQVPVELPEGVSRAGIEGVSDEETDGLPAGRFRGGNSGGIAASRKSQPMKRRIEPKSPPSSGYRDYRTTNNIPTAKPAEKLATADVDTKPDPTTARSPKLHPTLAAIVERLQKKSAAVSPEEARIVRDGKVEVQVMLTDGSPATIEKLKALGAEFVIAPNGKRIVVLKLAIEKLDALSKLGEVRYVTPQN